MSLTGQFVVVPQAIVETLLERKLADECPDQEAIKALRDLLAAANEMAAANVEPIFIMNTRTNYLFLTYDDTGITRH